MGQISVLLTGTGTLPDWDRCELSHLSEPSCPTAALQENKYRGEYHGAEEPASSIYY